MREVDANLGGRGSGQSRARIDTGIGTSPSVSTVIALDVAARGHRIRAAAETCCRVVKSAKE